MCIVFGLHVVPLQFNFIYSCKFDVSMDRRLKHEAKHCMEELQCNLVVMKRSRPKVLSFEFDWIIREGA